jgi:hypothetical protein
VIKSVSSVRAKHIKNEKILEEKEKGTHILRIVRGGVMQA